MAVDIMTERGHVGPDAAKFSAAAQRAEFMQAGRGSNGIDSAAMAAQVFIDRSAPKGSDHSSHVDAYRDSHHMETYGTFGVQNGGLARTRDGWPASAEGNKQLTLDLENQ